MKLARLYRQIGDYDRAMPLMRDTLTRQREGLGGQHPTTLIAGQEMADLLLASGDRDAAGSLYQSVLQAREAVLGDDHPDLIATLAGLAEVRQMSGRHGDYRRLMRRAVDLAERHPQLQITGFPARRQAFLAQVEGPEPAAGDATSAGADAQVIVAPRSFDE